ncbi:bifunctional Delta(1)-pyrroline-2-carboxylate/Delta(1)-piperideine-2-carboxylate reductase [Azospirillum isscasi]|uniref:Ornithine cyclodeaminase family protein n=1 Tax=Azospirillum isscasi TaxID=3053926 RepID=A0ABU0WG53_9PROT|nr:ornithine cyclodeaminase family protein [Azospirillum isscasi]MDQ2103186.1 ornithine cyclodeaminase family protein [Azospirillum isscasi]
MRTVTGAELKSVLHFRMLIERMRQTFRAGVEVPMRHHHTVETYGQKDGTLLLMPAWQVNQSIGVKVVTVFPDNGAKDLPAVQGLYLLMDGKTGMPQAVLDGTALTKRRTAAASALAASYLARPDSSRLLMVGTGALAPELIEAFATVLPIKHVLVWGRNIEKAKKVASRFHRPKFRIEATADLEGAVRGADVISCATLAKDPLIRGEWLQPGAHLDLVGGFTPDMREADDDCIRRSRVFVDTREGACQEAGDIVQPMKAGILTDEDIAGDLYDLTRGQRAGRRFYDQITLFKSVGTALEDLCAAQLAVEMVVHNDTIR